MITDPTTVVVAFMDGSIYEFDSVVEVVLLRPETPVLTLVLVDDKAVRLNYANVKFYANREDYVPGVRQR